MINKKILTLVSFLLLISLLVVGCILPHVNRPPEIVSDPVETVTVGEVYTYDVDATDPDPKDILTYSLIDEPTGMLIDEDNGVITWTPDAVGDFPVTVDVLDNGSPVLSDTQNFTITVILEVVIEPELIRIEVSPDTMTLLIGAPLAFDVTAYYDDGNHGEITPDCTYKSSNEEIATVVAGLVTAVAKGTATITVCYEGKSDTIAVTVKAIELTGIVVAPKTMTIIAGMTKDIESVTATYEIRGTEVPIALGDCTYASDDEDVATVSAAGLVEAVTEGTATITVTYEEMTDTVEVTVNEFELKLIGIEVDPETMILSVPIRKGLTETFVVTAYYNDDTDKVVTDDCVYGIDDTSIATIGNDGGSTVTALKVGTATITISYTEGVITKETTLAVIVEGEITIMWCWDGIRYLPDGTVSAGPWYNTLNGPATLILTDGGYRFDDVSDFYYGDFLTDAAGSIVIDETGQLSADITYTGTKELPIRDHFEGSVEIIIFADPVIEVVEGEEVTVDGTWVGTYTSQSYALEEVSEGDLPSYLGAVLAPEQGTGWWYILHTDHLVYDFHLIIP